MCVFFSSRRRHTRSKRDWSSDVCSSDLAETLAAPPRLGALPLTVREGAETWGRGERFGYVPLADGRVYCFAVVSAPEEIGRASCREGVEGCVAEGVW